MNKFVFIIPRTPTKHRNNFRNSLFEITLQSLRNQYYNNWVALIVDEKSKVEHNLVYIERGALTKKDKIKEAIEFVKKDKIDFDYLIRLDDDDIINPFALFNFKDSISDCIADNRQFLYDIKNNKFFYAKYPWLANTIFHKREHALKEINIPEKYMIAGDHDKVFLNYYRNKNIEYASIFNPIYARIYHPFTKSIVQFYNGDNVEFDWQKYELLLKRPRRWDRWNAWVPFGPKWFKEYKRMYKNLANEYQF